MAAGSGRAELVDDRNLYSLLVLDSLPDSLPLSLSDILLSAALRSLLLRDELGSQISYFFGLKMELKNPLAERFLGSGAGGGGAATGTECEYEWLVWGRDVDVDARGAIAATAGSSEDGVSSGWGVKIRPLWTCGTAD